MIFRIRLMYRMFHLSSLHRFLRIYPSNFLITLPAYRCPLHHTAILNINFPNLHLLNSFTFKSTSVIHLKSGDVPFYHQFSHQLLINVNGYTNLDKLYQTFADQIPEVQSSAPNSRMERTEINTTYQRN